MNQVTPHLWLGVLSVSISACASPPPDRVTLRVTGVVEENTQPEPITVEIDRGLIRKVQSTQADVSSTATPGFFSLWERSLPPTPEQLSQLLADGYTSLILVDAPLVDSLAIREYVGTGRGRGPRIYVSGPELSETLSPGASALRYRTRVQDAAALGAEFVVVDGAAGRDVLCTVVEEAKRQHVRVWFRMRNANELAILSACAADAVWLSPPLKIPLNSNTKTVWIGEHITNDEAIVARFNCTPSPTLSATRVSDCTSHSARTLGVDDAVGRLAPGYRADLVVFDAVANTASDNPKRRIFVDGVEQKPSVPWFARLLLTYRRWQVAKGTDHQN